MQNTDNMRKINEIIIHCSATPEGRDVSVDMIRTWHKERGFNDIGYHYVIDIAGNIHKGRKEDVAGAHCTGHNQNSIGICYVGGMNKSMTEAKDTRTAAQKTSLVKLIKELMTRYPGVSIHGHNEYAVKDCPSFNVKQWKEDVGL